MNNTKLQQIKNLAKEIEKIIQEDQQPEQNKEYKELLHTSVQSIYSMIEFLHQK